MGRGKWMIECVRQAQLFCDILKNSGTDCVKEKQERVERRGKRTTIEQKPKKINGDFNAKLSDLNAQFSAN